MNASTPTGEDSKQNLNQVINSIQKTLGILHQLSLTVSSFNIGSQLPLLHRLNNLVLELDNTSKAAEKCNIQVPMEVLNLIDDGKNPDEFTRDVLSSCMAKNQIAKGKTDAFKGLRKHLLEELEQAFPDEVENYKEMRGICCCELLFLCAMLHLKFLLSLTFPLSYFHSRFHCTWLLLRKFSCLPCIIGVEALCPISEHFTEWGCQGEG